jgi:hypothetical protein
MIKTQPKIIPFILRLIVGLIGLALLILAFGLMKEFIQEPSESYIIGVLTFLSLGLLFVGVGLLSIKTYSINDREIIENILGGLVTRKIELNEIDKMKIGQTLNGIGKRIEQIILNLKNETTVIIQDFDQKNYQDFKIEVEKYIEKDEQIKPNYFTRFWKIMITIIVIWIISITLILIF